MVAQVARTENNKHNLFLVGMCCRVCRSVWSFLHVTLINCILPHLTVLTDTTLGEPPYIVRWCMVGSLQDVWWSCGVRSGNTVQIPTVDCTRNIPPYMYSGPFSCTAAVVGFSVQHTRWEYVSVKIMLSLITPYICTRNAPRGSLTDSNNICFNFSNSNSV